MRESGLLFFNDLLDQALLFEGQSLPLESGPGKLLLLFSICSGGCSIDLIVRVATFLLQIGHVKHVNIHKTIVLLLQVTLIALDSAMQRLHGALVANQFIFDLCFELF